MPKITIDGKEYDTESMSEEAVTQLKFVQYLTNQILELQMRLGSYQTARNAYSHRLKELLEDGERSDDDAADITIPDNLEFDD